MGKSLPLSGMEGTLTLLKYILIVLPVYIAVILPLAIVTYPAKFFMKPAKIPSLTKTEFGYERPAVIEPQSARKYHAVIFGATGFTGRLAAKYIAKQYGSDPSLKFAIAGRNQAVLNSLKAELATYNPKFNVDVLVGDSSKPETLTPIIKSARVVMCTAGPFALHSSPVVQACARFGTHYVDITGESDWVRQMIDLNDDDARRTGAKIVHHCGHDCVPWDLAVMKVAEELKKKNQQLTKVEIFDEISENASGGTMATLFLSLKNRKKYKAALGFDPLMKPLVVNDTAPTGPSPSRTDARNQEILGFNQKALNGLGAWVGPFVMSMVMANCVRRSNAVNNYSGDGKLKYYEAKVYPSLVAGICNMIYMVVFGTCLYSPVLVTLLEKYVLQPGQGPSEELMDSGFLRVTVVGTGSENSKARATFVLETDPGYRDTARLLVESGLTLALEHDSIKVPGGVYTPAACLGDTLLKRVVDTGAKFQVDMIQ